MCLNKETVERFLRLPSGNVCDANGKGGNMHHSIKPLDPKVKVVGSAVTVKCFHGDNLTIHKAIYEAQPGSVLVIDAAGDSAGYFGDIMVSAAIKRGIAGFVIDGGCRDSSEIIGMDFPVFCKSINPHVTVKENLGKVNGQISCGGVVVNPGDIIFGDCDGVIVVPREKCEEVLGKAEAIAEREARILQLIDEGKSTLEIMGLDKLIESKGF